MNTIHSKSAERNAADAEERCSELNARPSSAAQSESKRFSSGASTPDDAMIYDL